ncbi:hypothetical protein F9C07_2208 [Aspergillus flavus]|uniref:Uncharacterized protein n=1 Tax=Aspergillus flavus (strain ATCC 200026 / FGSC A1120 / IAM 13836 / NRRL 3357 / JCM 12722 / SRRC 167) TaxID=332952 RepID=A0A7U2MFP4_ASPFN|nr:hypothetical protein F9C07_2208 [Aspergillus flavus]
MSARWNDVSGRRSVGRLHRPSQEQEMSDKANEHPSREKTRDDFIQFIPSCDLLCLRGSVMIISIGLSQGSGSESGALSSLKHKICETN